MGGLNLSQIPFGCSAFALFLLSALGGVSASSLLAASPQSSTHATKDYALIYGTVFGPNGRSVAGVPVKIRRSSDKKAKWELVSDNSGEFAQRVPVGAGDYVIQADVKVPKGQPKPEVTVHIDNDERKDISLHLTEQQLPKR